MKYSLRSLMTFSIRDLFWITVVVALAVGWWVEKRRAEAFREKARDNDVLELSNSKLKDLVWDYGKELERLRNSSAPAPNPPKP